MREGTGFCGRQGGVLLAADPSPDGPGLNARPRLGRGWVRKEVKWKETMSNMICINIKNGGDRHRTVTVEDLYALHTTRYPLVEGVLGPLEGKSIHVTGDGTLRGVASPGPGYIRVFSPERVSRTLTVGEGDCIDV